MSLEASASPQVMRPWPQSPQLYARLAGAIYLAVIVFGGFSEGVVTNRLITPDAATTAQNIMAASDLWRLSLAGNLIVPLIAVPQMWIEYLLLRPVSRGLALLFLLLNLVSLGVECVSKLFQLMVLPVLESGGYGGAFEPAQLYALADIALTAHDVAFHIALLFFGCACLVSGYLIFKATYFPKIVGVLMQLAGASYVVASLSELLAPAFANAITPWILLPVLVGEVSFCLWLLLMGVNIAKWNEQAGAGGAKA